MRTDEWLHENAIIPIYRRMYKEATPSADFDKLLSSGEANKPGWFMNYKLDMKRQIEIIEEVAVSLHLTKREFVRVQTSVILGCSPASSDFVDLGD
jgi:hypothetical protein